MLLKENYYRILSYLTIILAVAIQTVSGSDNKKPDVQHNRDKWMNSLTPAGRPGSELSLTANEKSDYRILLSKSPTTQDQKAADDLQTWLLQMTGAKLTVVKESRELKDYSRLISIGQTQLFKKSGLAAIAEDLKDEGYGIDQKGDLLFLWGGRTRGVINAVYALLEEDLGCRWYSNEAVIIPTIKTLKF